MGGNDQDATVQTPPAGAMPPEPVGEAPVEQPVQPPVADSTT
jgi:hypothetical protein